MAPFYFVTFNTFGRAPMLANEEVYRAFIRYAGRASGRGVAVGRYVVMPDHVHLFVWFGANRSTLEQWVGMLKTVLGKTLLARDVGKPHWQEGFFDHVLRGRESYAEKWAYVRENPVRKELVAQADDWPYQGEITALSF